MTWGPERSAPHAHHPLPPLATRVAGPVLTHSPCSASWGDTHSSKPETLPGKDPLGLPLWPRAGTTREPWGPGAEFAESCSFPMATSLCISCFRLGLPGSPYASGRCGCGSAAPKPSSF